jgi:hypothetical protein
MNKKDSRASTKESVWRHQYAAKYNAEITRRAFALRDEKEGCPSDPVKAANVGVKWQNKATVELYKRLATEEEKVHVERWLKEDKEKKEAERIARQNPTPEQQRG